MCPTSNTSTEINFHAFDEGLWRIYFLPYFLFISLTSFHCQVANKHSWMLWEVQNQSFAGKVFNCKPWSAGSVPASFYPGDGADTQLLGAEPLQTALHSRADERCVCYGTPGTSSRPLPVFQLSVIPNSKGRQVYRTYILKRQ
jgi:hypothetical protein